MLRILILAAGKGKRMKSNIPKVLHRVLNKPMIQWVINTSKQLNPEGIAVVLGHKADEVKKVLSDDIEIFIQPELLGTGHAVMCAKDFLNFNGDVVILYGDVPNIEAGTLKELIEKHRRESNSMTILTTIFENPSGYGRIVRDEKGEIISIVEETDANETTRKIKEINSGIYVFKADELLDGLEYLKNDNNQSEYYLTDIAKIFLDLGKRVGTLLTENQEQVIGINDRVQLANVEKLLRLRVNQEHMLNGVTIVDPDTTYIDPEVEIDMDTIIQPFTFICGDTRIGKDCEIGPFTIIKDCTIADNVRVIQSNCEGAKIFSNVSIGPFARLRPRTIIKENVRIGNFVEIKNSVVEKDVRAGHLSYIGDSEIGEDVNIGAGTITCNYDGFMKYKTKIGKGAFIGSNSALVAPINIGSGVIIGAGSVITEDVPEDSLGLGRARQVNKKGWARRWREQRKKEVQGSRPENKDA